MDSCEGGRIHDGNGYDRGQCMLCKGSGCAREVSLLGKPNLDRAKEQIEADIAKIKTWKDKALFYERILESSQMTLFDPFKMSVTDDQRYRRYILLLACKAISVKVADD